MLEKTLKNMGGEVYFALECKNKIQENEILKIMILELKRLIDIFNFFDENSLLSKLNKLKKIDYDEDLAFVLTESIKFSKLSKNKFNIFLGKDILERKNNFPASIIKKKYYSETKIKITNKTISILTKNLSIDLGGIAKGYIIDKILEKINLIFPEKIKNLLIDARGDIVSYGKTNKKISVENPFNINLEFEEIEIKTGAIITSGHNKQYFERGSHILGNESDVLSLTLKSLNKKCYELDALGTYLIQLNSNEILEKIEFETYFEKIDCLLILKNGKVLKSSFW